MRVGPAARVERAVQQEVELLVVDGRRPRVVDGRRPRVVRRSLELEQPTQQPAPQRDLELGSGLGPGVGVRVGARVGGWVRAHLGGSERGEEAVAALLRREERGRGEV